MRKVVYTFDILTLEELTGANKSAAMESLRRQMTEDWNEFTSNELLESIRSVCEHFAIKLTNWHFGLFDRNNTLKMDTGGFDENDEVSAYYWIKENLQDGIDGSCLFTGVYFDCLFFDYFKKHGVELDTIKRDIVRAVCYMLEKAVEEAENEIMHDASVIDYAKNHMYEFFEDGRLYLAEYDEASQNGITVCPTCKYTVKDNEVLHDASVDQNYCRNCFDPKNPDAGLLITLVDYLS